MQNKCNTLSLVILQKLMVHGGLHALVRRARAPGHDRRRPHDEARQARRLAHVRVCAPRVHVRAVDHSPTPGEREPAPAAAPVVPHPVPQSARAAARDGASKPTTSPSDSESARVKIMMPSVIVCRETLRRKGR